MNKLFFAALGAVFVSQIVNIGNSLDAAEGSRTVRNHHIPVDNVPVFSAVEHYKRASHFYNSEKWDKAAKEFRIVATHFPETTYGQDANYYLGVSYLNLNELDRSNEAFSKYLKSQTNPQFFQDSIEYKFYIAEKFRNGEKRRTLGFRQLPKWSYGYHHAIEIYDEVISAMPSNDIAAQAFYGKGCLLLMQKDYQGSVEAFQMLINRFPKCELAPDCFLQINRVYLEQCQREFQNPDLLAFAEINLRKFEMHFPSEERLDTARCELLRIKEVYAKGMYDTAYFYERINQPQAAVIYYQKAIVDFPETTVAYRCRSRLQSFCPRALEDLNNRPIEIQEDIQEIPDAIDFTGCLNPKEKGSA